MSSDSDDELFLTKSDSEEDKNTLKQENSPSSKSDDETTKARITPQEPENQQLITMEEKRLKLQRGQCKGTLTKAENFFKETDMEQITMEELEIREKLINDAYNNYKKYTIELQVLKDINEEDDFEERYLALAATIKRFQRNHTPSETALPAASSTICKTEDSNMAKLPLLDIPVFDGTDVSCYKPFMEMFDAVVHDNANIPKIQKLCFLKKYLKGEALDNIDNLPIIGDSYMAARKLLEDRFNNPALLVSKHINCLLEIPSFQHGSAQQLRSFASKVRQHLTALKNLNQPVESWDALLCSVLLKKLDQYHIKMYHAEKKFTQMPTIKFLLEFIDNRAGILEASANEKANSIGKFQKKSVSLATVAQQKQINCRFCSQPGHKLFKCDKFIALTSNKRLAFITENKLCKICLSSHSNKCRYHFKCETCNSSLHNGLLHPENSSSTEQVSQLNTNGESTTSQVLHSFQPALTSVLLPTAKVLVSDVHGNKYVVRALLDSGSQTSFCTASLADKLGLPIFNQNKNIMSLGQSSQQTNQGIDLTIHSMTQNFKVNVSCSIINKITTQLPQKRVKTFRVPKNILLADDEYDIPGDISILLAADIFFSIVQDGKVEGGPEDPILINTRLGYIISGAMPANCNLSVTMHTVLEPEIDQCVKQFWEAEKVPEVYQETLPEHEYSEQIFNESVKLENNKFEVKIPLKMDLKELDPSNSFAIALQRLHNLNKRFLRDPNYYELYKQFINEYMELGHAKKIDMQTCDPKEQPKFYLPHHGVLRPDKETTKLRVVFDGSAKTKNGLSLNDTMCNGPVVQKTLLDILLLFRKYKYTVQCDIRHMYRGILIHPDFRVLQNILWKNETGDLECLQLQTVTYGLTGSAFLATRCLIELAKRYKSKYPLASDAIINNSYVDDIQGGSDTLQGAIQLRDELIAIMQHASFQLHKWSSNNQDVLDDLPENKLSLCAKQIDPDKSVSKILGLSFSPRDDVFKVSGRVITAAEKPTKRSILSSVSRLWDPTGIAGPVTLRAKLILQQLWQYNLEWDTPLPQDLVKIWQLFYKNLDNEIEIPRYSQIADSNETELAGFCDASANAYGCCIYIKVKVNNEYNTHLLCSKSRVSPLNSKLTIPKLELNGALLLAKLAFHVSSLLGIANVNLFCDSKIVLGWLGLSPIRLPAYIGNRTKEISKLCNGMHWHYTPTLLNPADILSRGAEFPEIVNNNLWKHGPDYLKESSNYNFHLQTIETPLECHTNVENDCNNKESKSTLMPFFEKFSDLHKMIRVMIHVLRFVDKCKKKCNRKGHFSVMEYRNALTCIIKGIQRYYFDEELKSVKQDKEIKSNLKSLHPFLDKAGILRVGGRLQNANQKYSKKFPIILPKKCHFTKILISAEHLMLMHGGLKLLMGSLSQRYYIINCIREIKSVIHKCIVCYRHRAETAKQLMGSLPCDRVNPARAFEKVGMDYCGPFEIKQSTIRRSVVSKGYVVVFVCFASKAAHLEVVTDMTTDTFLAALKRFISRRGVPTDMHCDNASTFKSANSKLKELYALHQSEEFQNAVSNYALQKNIQFHFIPKYSPNHGGLWEACVKSFKFHFKRIASPKIFTYEQFNTIITEIESILNSRPLTPMSQDINDFSCLTPGHLLIGTALTALPQPDITEIPSNRLRLWRSCEQTRQHFWKAWATDYLSTLNKRTKWQKDVSNLKQGMLVLLKNPNTPPSQWPLGRIERVFSGNDSKIRVVEVRTANKKLHSRAISKIIVLPTEN